MTNALTMMTGGLAKAGIALLVVNEVRGIVMAAPVFYEIFGGRGDLTTLWLALCALAGILLTVIVPHYAVRNFALARSSRARRGLATDAPSAR